MRRWMADRPGGLEVFGFETIRTPDPGRGEVRLAVAAAGVNPADLKHVARGAGGPFPRGVGYEVAGTVAAVGPGVDDGWLGRDVLAFRIAGGWADQVVVRVDDVFERPESLPPAEAANLLLAACTAAEMLHVSGAAAGETVLVHGASGAVGVILLQLAARTGVRVVGTASGARGDVVRRYGGVPVTYGAGLEDRVRDLLDGAALAAALDCVGTDEAVDVSLALIAPAERARRVVTIAAPARAAAEGFRALAGSDPDSAAYRDSIRADLVALAGTGDLEVPMAGTHPLEDALDAARVVLEGHPGGKLALIP